MQRYHLCTQGYTIVLRDKPKLRKQSALLQSVKGDSIDVDGCALLKYEIGTEKQEHEYFIVPQME